MLSDWQFGNWKFPSQDVLGSTEEWLETVIVRIFIDATIPPLSDEATQSRFDLDIPLHQELWRLCIRYAQYLM